jgi:choline dehydrogenase
LSETGGSLELVIDESEFAFGYLRLVGPHDGIPGTKQNGKHAMKLGATEFSDNATHDYVIVGAGTAGCVLAARLSESPSAGVLPLEAGSSEPLDAMAVPAAWPTLLSTSADWADKTQSYDEWAVAGWGFDELLPFFRRSERTVGRDENLRGTNGPLAAGPAATTHPSTHAGLAAADELGFNRARDIGSDLEEGFNWIDFNVVEGRRQSAADAYLKPALGRPTLKVITGISIISCSPDGCRRRYLEAFIQQTIAQGTLGNMLSLGDG